MNEIALPTSRLSDFAQSHPHRQSENAVGAVGEWRDCPAAAFVRLPGHCRPESLCVRGATPVPQKVTDE
jgi:hypothetical protein